MKNLRILISELKLNTMFRLSLGAKELFHTNYWALLLSKYPAIMTPVFCKDKTCSAKDIRREAKHTDLSFQIDNGAIIIENKFESYPYIEQLQKYVIEQRKKDANFNKIILISFFEPHFLIKENNIDFEIEYISYEILLDRLKRIDSNLIHTKDYPFFSNYIEMLEILVKIKECLSLKNKSYKEVYEEILEIKEELQEINFYTTIQRLFLNQLRCDLLKDESIGQYEPFTNVDFAPQAKEIFLDIMMNYENNSLGIQNIGITIANDCNIRHYIGAKKFEKERIEIEATLNRDLDWFFKDCFGHKNNKTRFKGYDMEDAVWLYKTHTKDSILDCNFNDIKELILNKFSLIRKNLD